MRDTYYSHSLGAYDSPQDLLQCTVELKVAELQQTRQEFGVRLHCLLDTQHHCSQISIPPFWTRESDQHQPRGDQDSMASKPKPSKTERTFIMVKPDGVQRCLIGEIITRFEQKGFKLVAMKFTKV